MGQVLPSPNSRESLDVLARARELARRAHAGQLDQAGRPYIEHVERVAAAVADDSRAEAAAWLHDVLEDCPDFREEVWNRFPAWLLDILDKLTRIPNQPSTLYYARVARHPIALRVKIADVRDNANEARLALLEPVLAARLRRKYKLALTELGQLITRQPVEP